MTSMHDNDHSQPTAPAADATAEETPEAYNAEQDDESGQSHQVAADAQGAAAGSVFFEGEESEHGGKGNDAQIISDDAQDVVDHMNQMESSGRIDMGAFRGERSDDDESGMLGEGGLEPGDLDEHGNPAPGQE